MLAVLLNPPKTRKKKKEKARKRKAKRRPLSKECKAHIRRTAYKRGAPKRAATKRRKARAAARARREAAALERRDPFSALPSHYAANPRRRRRRSRRRRRNASYNYGRRYRRRNRSNWLPAFKNNPAWVPSYAMNPRAGIIKTITKGYSPAVLKKAVPIVSGAILNTTVGRMVSARLPEFFQTGIPNVLVNLGTAGLLGAGAGFVKKSWTGPVFLGGVIEAVMRIAHEYVVPLIPGMSGCLGCGLGDYATQMVTAEYLPNYYDVSGINQMQSTQMSQSSIAPTLTGMGDYLTRANAAEARPLGDYLTRSNAAEVRPLGAYALHEAPIDGVAATELGLMA